jgi:uncharacterized membrane protein YqjE
MDRPDESPGPASNLLRSSVGLLGSFLSIAQTRVDLLTTELQEEVQRAGKMLLAAFAALLAAVLGLLLLGLSVVVFFWDTHRLGATLGVAAVFLGGAVAAAWIARNEIRERPRLLDSTRSELARDVAELRRHS